MRIGFFVCEVVSWRKQDHRIGQVKTLGCPCFEKENPGEAVLVRPSLAPVWLPRLLLGDEVFCIFVSCLCGAPCNWDLDKVVDRVGEFDVAAHLVQQWVADPEEVVVGQQVVLVAQEGLQVAQVEPVEQRGAQVALEACFDLEEVVSPCEKQKPLQEVDEQRVGRVESSWIEILEECQAPQWWTRRFCCCQRMSTIFVPPQKDLLILNVHCSTALMQLKLIVIWVLRL